MAAREYDTQQEAYERVEKLKEQFGCWPGVVHQKDGAFRLTFEPDPLAPPRGAGR